MLPLLVVRQLADVLLLALGRLRVQPLVALLQVLLLQEVLQRDGAVSGSGQSSGGKQRR